jgi:hypothetical protein
MEGVGPAKYAGHYTEPEGTTTMTKKTNEGVPALQNDDVTGMTEEKQEEIIRRSGRAPRKDAAEEFYEEQGEQARETPAPPRSQQQGD